MSNPDNTTTLGVLGRQSLRRPLTSAETALARALEEVFATGQHEFPAVVEYLSQRHIVRPSGIPGPWTLEVLQVELQRINASLDDAYCKRNSDVAGR